MKEQHYAAEDYFPQDLEAERQRQERWNRKRIARLKSLIHDAYNKKVLDFGCGSGGFLQRAQGVFREVIGFDLNKRFCASHQAAGWACFNSLEQVPKDIEVIVLFHVLEHVPEPWNLLMDLQARFLRAEMYVIEVPNTEEVLNSLFKNAAYRRNHFSADHVYYFTSETLRRVVEFAGLEIVVESQLQRYTLANNLGWISNDKGGGQDLWDFFNDEQLNEHYERVLVSQNVADSLFFVSKRRNQDEPSYKSRGLRS